MQNIYSHDEIVAFVDGHLKRMGANAMKDRRIASEVAGWISQLPPLFQVLTIASQHDLVFADVGTMNRLFKDAGKTFTGGVVGFYSSGESEFDNVGLNHPVFFYRGSHGGINAVTASHEKTHDFDLMLGRRYLKKEKARFYSSINKEWEWALERQIEKICSNTKFENEDPAELLCWGREELSSVFAAQSKGTSLYDDYRPLLDHLSLYDTKEKRLPEAKAEMGAHYAMLYAQTGGDECAIDLKLSARYPELWEEFRDNVLPQYEEMALEFLAERDAAIKDYVAHAARMADMYGFDVREDDLVMEAAIVHAGGRMDEAMAFKEAAVELVLLRGKIAGEFAGAVPPEKLKYVIVNGLHEIIESRSYNEIERRRRILAGEIFLLRSYINEVNRLAAIASLYTGAQGGKPEGWEILARYDEVKTEKGIEGIQEATENLIISGEDIKEYVSLRKDYDDWLQSIYERGPASVPFMQVANDVALTGPERKHSAGHLARIADEIMEMGFGKGAEEMDDRKAMLRRQILILKSNATGLDIKSITGGLMSGGMFAPGILRRAVVDSSCKFEP